MSDMSRCAHQSGRRFIRAGRGCAFRTTAIRPGTVLPPTAHDVGPMPASLVRLTALRGVRDRSEYRALRRAAIANCPIVPRGGNTNHCRKSVAQHSAIQWGTTDLRRPTISIFSDAAKFDERCLPLPTDEQWKGYWQDRRLVSARLARDGVVPPVFYRVRAFVVCGGRRVHPL